MYIQGSSEFNTIIETPNNQALIKRLVLTDDDTEIENIMSITSDSSSSQNELQIGTTNMSYIEVTAVTDKILTNREVRLECGVKLSDGTIEYAPMGIYTIQKPKGDIDKITFKANDKMQKFEKPYISSLSYPTTSDKVLEELCTMCGVELATPIDTPIAIAEKLDGYTCREILGYIAGIHTKFACFDRLGKLNLRWYSNTPIEKKIGLIYEFSKAENNFTVSKIELAKDAETKYTSGSGFGIVYHSNPLATQEIADSIFNSLNGFTYNATSLNILDDIRLDLGDIVKVEYLDGIEYLVPCMSLKQDFTQGSTSIEAYSKTDEENEYRYTGPTTKYIERVAHELLLANRIIATKVDAEYVNSHAITTDNLDAITANITNLVVERIDGQYADIHLANIDIADIGLFFANSGLLKDVTIVEGHITGELDAVRINADVITAGTLSVDRLLVTGKDSIVYQINVDSSGLTMAELEDEVYQKYLNGTDIVANSITATQLNVAQIFADTTVTSTLFAQNITATGTITGATLIGADADIEKGNIGDWSIVGGMIEATTNDTILRSSASEYDLSGISSNGLYSPIAYISNGKEKITMSANGDNVYLEFAVLDDLDRNKKAFHINYYGVDKLLWSNDFTTYTTTTILGFLDSGIYTPDINADRADIISLYAKNFEFYKGKCAGLHITSANSDDILIIEQTTNGLIPAKIGFKNPLGMLGYLGQASVDGSFIRYKADNSASYVILDKGNYENFVVPKTGGQFTGRLQVPMGQGGSYLDSVTYKNRASIYVYNAASLESYHPIITGVTGSGHTWNLGVIGNIVGFHSFLSSRKENGIDYYVRWETNTGLVNILGSAKVSTKIQSPRFEFGSSYSYYLNADGEIYANNIVINNAKCYYIRNSKGTIVTGISMSSDDQIYVGTQGYTTNIRGSLLNVFSNVTIPNNAAYMCKNTSGTNVICMIIGLNNELLVGYDTNCPTKIGGKTIQLSKYTTASVGIVVPNNVAYFCRNSSGSDINAVFMTANNVLRFGYGASDVWIGNHGTTNRTMIYGARIDFCCNTAGTSETNPALSLVSSAGGANLTLRPTTVNAVATYLGNSTYYFNTIYYATLSQISDRTTKKDIYDISEKYLELWDKLSVKTFRYIDDDKTIKVGLIAQEVEECAYKVGLTNEECGFILKEYVDNEIHKGYRYSLDYTGLATITMARLKKTIEIVTEHDKRIQDLEDEIAILKATINHLQAQYA